MKREELIEMLKEIPTGFEIDGIYKSFDKIRINLYKSIECEDSTEKARSHVPSNRAPINHVGNCSNFVGGQQ